MLDFINSSVLGTTLTAQTILICSVASLILGLGIAGAYMYKNSYNKGFVMTLALLPAIVQIVIMMVNGNIGTGVAVAGAFSLVRFRSLPGTARDILSIFFAMAVGLATGMGYLGYAVIFLIIIGIASILLIKSRFGEVKSDKRTLRVTIPEDLDYDSLFDDLFEEYASSCELQRIKTTNMGSMFELSYQLELKSPKSTKSFIDALRCRNGNLNITLSRPLPSKEEL